MITTVANVMTDKWDVYIGRSTLKTMGYFGNPFKMGCEADRIDVCDKYREYFYSRLATDQVFKRKIHELQGKILGCYCTPKQCHGDIIAEYLNGLIAS